MDRRFRAFNRPLAQASASPRPLAWSPRDIPAPPRIAIDPKDPDRLMAATESGRIFSADAGSTWRPAGSELGLLAWPASDRLVVVTLDGQVLAGAPGGTLRPRGALDGQPVSVMASGQQLYVALADGRVMASPDAGASGKLLLLGTPSTRSTASAWSSRLTRAQRARVPPWRRCPRSSRVSTADTGRSLAAGATRRGTA